MVDSFPPRPAPGCRVWSGSGYRDHGPMEGPKIDIPPKLGGVVVAAVQPYLTMDFLLYTVRWDNGQFSKHYFKELQCIGRFAEPAEFDSSIDLLAAKVTVGPYGGFRGAEVRVRYDGVEQESRLSKDEEPLWRKLERMAAPLGIEIEVVRLSVKGSPVPPSPHPIALGPKPGSSPRTSARGSGRSRP